MSDAAAVIVRFLQVKMPDREEFAPASLRAGVAGTLEFAPASLRAGVAGTLEFAPASQTLGFQTSDSWLVDRPLRYAALRQQFGRTPNCNLTASPSGLNQKLSYHRYHCGL